MAAAVRPDCKSESEKQRFPTRMQIRSGTIVRRWWAPAGRIANPNPKHRDFRLGIKSEAEIRPGLQADMIVGVHTVVSDPDLNPGRKSHRTDSGMRSVRPLSKISQWNFRLGFESKSEMIVCVPTIISDRSPPYDDILYITIMRPIRNMPTCRLSQCCAC